MKWKTDKKEYLVLTLIAIALVLTGISLSVVSAEVQTLPPVKQLDCINLPQFCSNSTYSTIKTVRYPNGTEIYYNYAMTKTGDVYNYSFCNTGVLGSYIVNGFCDPLGITTSWAYDFEVNNSGQSLSTGDSIIMILGFVAIGILVLVFFVYGMRTDNPIIRVFSLGMAVLFLVFLFGYGYNMFNTLLGKYPAMANSLNGIYVMLIVLLTCAGVGVILWLIAFALNSWWKYRGFKD